MNRSAAESELLRQIKLQQEVYDVQSEIRGDDDQGVVIAKVTAMIVLFCASTFFGLIPYKLSKWFNWGESNSKTSVLIELLLAFGGGVLLSTTFLHLLPEIAETINLLQLEGKLPIFRFHLAEFLMCIGFFSMYFVEELVHTYLERRLEQQSLKSTENAFQRGLSVRNSSIIRNSKIFSSKETLAFTNMNFTDQDGIQIKSLTPVMQQRHLTTTPPPPPSTNFDTQLTSQTPNTLSISQNLHSSILIPPQSVPEENNINNQNNNHNHHSHLHHHHHHHHHHHGHGHSHIGDVHSQAGTEDVIVTSIRGLLIVLALSVHELFEGLAVGLESSESTTWYMFGAVSAHKLVLAFCVGVELVVNRTRLWLILFYVTTFAIVSPLGIGIGIILSNGSNADNTVIPSVILQGLASGTLLYVVFFEILSKTTRSDLKQYATILLGFLLMFALQFATGHQHSHGGGAGDDHDHAEHDHHDEHNATPHHHDYH